MIDRKKMHQHKICKEMYENILKTNINAIEKWNYRKRTKKYQKHQCHNEYNL
jgi:hypothetical protein